MRSWLVGSAVAAAVCCVLPSGGFACDAGRVQYKDGFETMDLLWGLPNDLKKVENGAFLFTLAPGTLDFSVNQFQKFQDVDICVTSAWKAGNIAEQTWSGVVFWAANDENLYAFGVSPQGTISIWRLIDNKWINPLRWSVFDAVKQGAGAVNKIRVVTRGDQATFFVNDVQVGSMRGAPPDGHFVGVIAEALERSDPVMHAFDDFVVALPADEAAEPADAPQAAVEPPTAEPAPAAQPAPAAESAPAAPPAPAEPAPAAAEPAQSQQDAAQPAADAEKAEAESPQPGAVAQPAEQAAKPAEAPNSSQETPAEAPAEAPTP